MRVLQSEGLAITSGAASSSAFALPPLDTMQNYRRLKFLYDCIRRFAPASGVALEVGRYKCTSTVFIPNTCEKAGVRNVNAIDLFTGTRRGTRRAATSRPHGRNSLDRGWPIG
jgi:hypothetical protein